MRESPYRLVVFDMDGVLFDYVSSWKWVHDVMEVDNSHNLQLFKDGKIDEAEFIRRDVALWKTVKPDMSINDVNDALRNMPIIDGLQETIATLRYNDITSVIVSGGIDIAAKRIALGFDFDDYAANTLITNGDGTLAGEGILNVDLSDKGIRMREFMAHYGVPKEETVAIGNSFVDVKMFENAGFSIAFNPIDDEVIRGADVTVESRNIADILDHIMVPRNRSSA